MNKFKHAYLCQSNKNWQQVALAMEDGSTIFVDIPEYERDPHVSYMLTAEGEIIPLSP